ncbi:hypothetical protein PHYBOEH_006098 [Phytophthora boehmeriae]|uniref:RxLR effector protein n=1 Tax=Phytophthora boehmeriae TaxID=109152 RepID=A0A8T1X420_9STRA|nr:hypothetical protein PHYBOEH_006098 [Phytophthora boehmeriae]
MRISNFLLVAAAAFLANCKAVSRATDLTRSQLSMMTSLDVMQPKETVYEGKRFLRATKTEASGDDDDDNDDDDNLDNNNDDNNSEERGFGFKSKADDVLRKLIDDFPGANDRISHWRYNEMTPAQVKKELRITNMKDKDDPNVELYKLFLAADLRSHFKLS